MLPCYESEAVAGYPGSQPLVGWAPYVYSGSACVSCFMFCSSMVPLLDSPRAAAVLLRAATPLDTSVRASAKNLWRSFIHKGSLSCTGPESQSPGKGMLKGTIKAWSSSEIAGYDVVHVPWHL